MTAIIQHHRIFAQRSSNGGGGGTGSGFSGVVDNYSALPAAASHSGEFYYVRNSQGTSWLPGSLGGTYYPSGVYYSTGTDWITGVSPWQATQAEVDAGVLDNVFVSPLTLKNAAQWNSLALTQGITQINSGIDQGVLYQSGTTLKQSNIFKFDEATGRFNINNVTTPTGNINIKATSVLATDLSFILKHPLETYNILQFANNGSMTMRAQSSLAYWEFLNNGGQSVVQIGVGSTNGSFRVGSQSNVTQFMANGSTDARMLSAGVVGKGKFGIGVNALNSTSLPNENSTNILFFNTGVNPALNWATGYQQYSSNNGTFHYPEFRLSDGKVVKLEPISESSITDFNDLILYLKSIGLIY